jgi:hypothetical protein
MKIKPYKLCPKCGLTKDRSDFYSKKRGSLLIATNCKECSKKIYQEKKHIWRKKQRETYIKNKSQYLERTMKTRQKKIDWLLDYYGTDKIHCERCHYDNSFAAIQFHHLDPSQKENVGDSFSKWLRILSFEKFIEKILTTTFIPLCANCHAELHAGVWQYGE